MQLSLLLPFPLCLCLLVCQSHWPRSPPSNPFLCLNEGKLLCGHQRVGCPEDTRVCGSHTCEEVQLLCCQPPRAPTTTRAGQTDPAILVLRLHHDISWLWPTSWVPTVPELHTEGSKPRHSHSQCSRSSFCDDYQGGMLEEHEVTGTRPRHRICNRLGLID